MGQGDEFCGRSQPNFGDQRQNCCVSEAESPRGANQFAEKPKLLG